MPITHGLGYLNVCGKVEGPSLSKENLKLSKSLEVQIVILPIYL